jgi:hypothetical protein
MLMHKDTLTWSCSSIVGIGSYHRKRLHLFFKFYWLAHTLDVSLVLNADTVHQRTLLPNFPIFALLHTFLAFFLQNWNL